MNTKEIIKNLGKQTGGDIYLGIVGPVRVGKSTFIRKFIEKAVLPYIEDEYDKARMIDELPQAGMGKTIMTMEPKFVPNTAANIQFEDGFNVHVRLVDCVGYVINEAKGYRDEDGMRYVKTPWSEEALPFDEAAKIGTQKVIQEHATIGIVVTTDGSITDLKREDYIEAEHAVISELQAISKPFIVLVNTTDKNGLQCTQTVKKLSDKYNVPVLGVDIEHLNEKDIHDLLKEALYEFPISKIELLMSDWLAVLDENHPIKKSFNDTVLNSLQQISKLKEVSKITDIINENEYIENSHLANIDTGEGIVQVERDLIAGLYNRVLKDVIGEDIQGKAQLISLLQTYSKAKKEYDTISSALKMVKQTGYGFASAGLNEIALSKPEIVKQGNRYGVKLKAIAPSIHMIKVDVESIFEPIIGSKEQSEELVNYLLREDDNENAIWDSDIFGRKLSDLIKDGLNAKLSTIPEAARMRLQEILEKLINKGKGNVIAIVL